MPLFYYLCAMKQLLFILIIILSVATHAAERPDSVTVYGRVLYDKDKEPIPGVVILNLTGLNILGGCQTDVDGNFSLVAPIETELSFRFPGLETETISVTPTLSLPLEIVLRNVEGTYEYVNQPPKLVFVVTDKDGNKIEGAELYTWVWYNPEMPERHTFGLSDSRGQVEGNMGRLEFVSPYIEVSDFTPIKKQAFFISATGYKTIRILVKKQKSAKKKIINVKLKNQ